MSRIAKPSQLPISRVEEVGLVDVSCFIDLISCALHSKLSHGMVAC